MKYESRTQFFLKQSWEQKKLCCPSFKQVGHCKVLAPFTQLAPKHFWSDKSRLKLSVMVVDMLGIQKEIRILKTDKRWVIKGNASNMVQSWLKRHMNLVAAGYVLNVLCSAVHTPFELHVVAGNSLKYGASTDCRPIGTERRNRYV